MYLEASVSFFFRQARFANEALPSLHPVSPKTSHELMIRRLRRFDFMVFRSLEIDRWDQSQSALVRFLVLAGKNRPSCETNQADSRREKRLGSTSIFTRRSGFAKCEASMRSLPESE